MITQRVGAVDALVEPTWQDRADPVNPFTLYIPIARVA